MTAPGDGTFDVVVVDAGRIDDEWCSLELVVSTGPAKGEVLELRVGAPDLDPVELLGLPGVVEVRDGEPRFLLS